jgi:hypothetical protein
VSRAWDAPFGQMDQPCDEAMMSQYNVVKGQTKRSP